MPIHARDSNPIRRRDRQRGLRRSFGAVPETVTAQVEAVGADELTRWTRRVLSAPTIEDVFAAS